MSMKKQRGPFRIVGRVIRTTIPERMHKWVLVDGNDVAYSYHATWGEAERVRRAKNREARKGRRAA